MINPVDDDDDDDEGQSRSRPLIMFSTTVT